MHDTLNELFGTKKRPPKQQTNPKAPTKPNKHWGWEPLARHSGAPAGSCAATSWWLRGWPQAVAAALRLLRQHQNRCTDSLHKFWFQFFISAPSQRNYFSGGKIKNKKPWRRENISEAFGFLRIPFSTFSPSLPFRALRTDPQSEGSGHPVCTAPTPRQSSLGLR